VKSEIFRIEEFVDPEIYKVRGEKAWELIDVRIIITAEALKKRFPLGTMTINNWVWGGDRLWSGLRTPRSKYYSETSQHSFGRALDCVFSAYSAKEVRQYVITNPEEFPYVTGIEDFDNMSWVHLDCRNTVDGAVAIFKG
jgi:hypothetical protein